MDEEQNWNWNVSFFVLCKLCGSFCYGKDIGQEDFTEEVLELPKCQGTKYTTGTGSSGQRHKDATQHSQLRKQNMVSRM